jgi:hypothetical protein
LSETLTGWGCDVRASEDRQLPRDATLVEAQNVQITVVTFNLEVAIVWSIPLIDDLDNFDLTPIDRKRTGLSSPRWLVRCSTCTRMVVLFFLVRDIVGAVCPHNKLFQLSKSKQRQQARKPRPIPPQIAGTNPAGSAKDGAAAECQLKSMAWRCTWSSDASRSIAGSYQNVCDELTF